MRFFFVPKIIQSIFPGFVWHIPTNEKVIYLTFDDGPSENLTSEIVALLDRFSASATFFCVGQNAEKFYDKVKMLKENGHSVGNHCYSHLNGWHTGVNEYVHDVQKAADYTSNKVFRPPYGKIKFKQASALRKLGYKLIMWDVLTNDFDRTLETERAWKNFRMQIRSGSIVVLHDNEKSYTNTLDLTAKILTHFSGKGFMFKAL